MMAGAQFAAVALPALDPAIPLELHVPAAGGLSVPLAIALLEANIITDRMLKLGRNATLVEVFGEPDERELTMVALSRWWAGLIKRYSCKFFRWNLHVQQLVDTGHAYDDAMTAWFCFTRQQNRDIPRFSLARRTEQLEAVLEGFGQTVLAVLYDATLRLPDSFTPWRAAEFAEYTYWNFAANDEEMLEELREMNGYETTARVVEELDPVTRAAFYSQLPRWVAAPQRVVSREAIERAARERFEKSVIAACDAIAELVSQPGFFLHPSDIGAHRCGLDSTDGSMVLLWTGEDMVGRVIDDTLNQFWEGGNSSEFIDTHPVPMTAAGVLEFQKLAEQMMQLAVLTERLVLLVGDPL